MAGSSRIKICQVIFLSVVLLSCSLIPISADKFDDEDEDVQESFSDSESGETKVLKEEIIHDIVYVTPNPSGPVYFAEHFDDESAFNANWIKSSAKKDGVEEDLAKYDGVWSLEALEKEPLDGDLGLVLKSKAKHAAISAKLTRPFSFKAGKPLIVQYEVTFQHGMDCGGAYMKLISDQKKLDLPRFHDKTKYSIMFGPDKCGNDYKLHFIFQHRHPKTGVYSEKHAKRPSSKIEEVFKDKKPHLFTLVLNPDNTFEVRVDDEVANSGSLLTDFEPPVNPEKEIDDPADLKPEDWDEREKIPDPEAKKPEDWDEDAPRRIHDDFATKPDGWLENEEEMIPDPEAKKPEDWDDEMDGAWEPPLINNPTCETAPGCGKWMPPLIDNPAYKGKWYPPMIDNPAYKGKWFPRKIPNPDYYEDLEPFKMDDIGAIGFELWSMSDGVYFDNIVITSDKKVADDYARDSFQLKRDKQDAGEDTLFRRLVRYTNKNPWMWAVIVVVVGLPFVLILTFCCGGTSDKSATEVGQAKKTDAPSPDDEEEEPEGGEEIDVNDDRNLIKTSSGEKKPNKADLEMAAGDNERVGMENEEEAEEDEEEEDDEEEEEDGKEESQSEGEEKPLVNAEPNSSPRRRRARKD